ncbi:hypothetical protein Q0Z83_100770 [Actinoplanes sichuanensis]|nr:hypothetical protein Q0Z83_100770 [Actinoplanes sichuanensis]
MAFDRRVQGGAQRPQIGLDGRGAVAGALRGDILRRADYQPGRGHPAVVDKRGKTKIGQDDAAVGTDEHVVRLHVTVQDASPVGGAERVQHG